METFAGLGGAGAVGVKEQYGLTGPDVVIVYAHAGRP
jgi:hypothetical protein